MHTHPLMVKAAGAVADVISHIRSDQLDQPTPCPELSVGKLINHVIVWSGYQAERYAHKQRADPALNDDSDFLGGDWQAIATTQVRKAADAWGEPGAFEGTSYLSQDEYPAPLVALALLSELVLHGWDLAVATGQRLALTDEEAGAAHDSLAIVAEQGRQYGLYGTPVPVPESAPALDRTLGMFGRDPAWQPAGVLRRVARPGG